MREHVYSFCRKEIHGTTVKNQPSLPRPAEWMRKSNSAENMSVYKIRMGKVSMLKQSKGRGKEKSTL